MLVLTFYLFQDNTIVTPFPPLQKEGIVAVLTRVANATWDNETSLLHVRKLSRGSQLPTGHLKLKSGLVQIEFFHGAVVILEGPADFELIDSQRAYLHYGKLRSYVPMPSRGFVIETPQRKLIDHGTEFGLSVNATGLTEVHVFEGKVEMQGQDSEYLTAGESKQFSNADAGKSIPFNQAAFSGPATLAVGANQQLIQQHAKWKKHASTLAKDPAALVYYLFDKHDEWGRSLKDISTTPHNGAIVGSQWAEGRWHQKEALEFKRTTDRVRISVPNDFQSITFMAWVRIEGFDQWLSALMLTDGFQQGEVHWQLSDQGELILGVSDKGQAVNYFSPQILSADDLGRWVHLATVYDHQKKQVIHYRDGKQVSQQKIKSTVTLRIGTAEIGNWNTGHPQSRSVRSLNGLIDEFAIFSRPFDAEEIKKHYTIGKPN